MRERIPALLSLQDLAINTIVKNIGGYRDLIQKTLSPPTRKIVFDRAMERIKDIGEDKVWAALPYLDQHRTTESFSSEDFAGIFRLQGKILQIPKGRISMEEFLQYLVEFVPNLKQLEIQGPRKTFVDKILYKKIELEPLATDLILKMENLTHISMDDVRIKFSGFLRVCEENQNLQSIQAQNILIDIQPLNSIKNILKKHDSKFDQQEYDLQKFPKKIGIAFKKTSDQEHYREAKLTLPNDFLDQIPSGVTKLEVIFILTCCGTINSIFFTNTDFFPKTCRHTEREELFAAHPEKRRRKCEISFPPSYKARIEYHVQTYL
ncbi:Hypothetical predicted protein [Cloeon dipterum]|uniref:Uncharacterized protein n=1 Tax=Cloeon dipterum TaxID=197152 RepID=A0A8S1DEU5_9INSE|nr:Hypothetical predicted protein [Cloeon dipterum]